MSLDQDTRQRISSVLEGNDVVVFMKGTPTMPQCGFSATVVQILGDLVTDFASVDVLAEPGIRDGIKAYSNWPTIPQLYIKGEFVGGCDIVKDMYASGDLHKKLGVELEEVSPPQITVTDAAAGALREASKDANEGDVLLLGVNVGFEVSLQFGPSDPSKLVCEANGITIVVDRGTAGRANGLVLDFLEGPNGSGFKVENPNAPPEVVQISATDVKARLDAGEDLLFLDVRTPEERDTASIEGTRLVTQDVIKEVEALDKNTVLIFHCHHGGRSQKAAEHFRNLGFKKIHNMTGGIDAWSQQVDSSVPRY